MRSSNVQLLKLSRCSTTSEDTPYANLKYKDMALFYYTVEKVQGFFDVRDDDRLKVFLA